MAISLPTRSSQYAQYASSPFPSGKPVDAGNQLFEIVTTLVFSAAGFTAAASGDVSLLRLPPGRLRIRCDLSRIVCPQGTATARLDLGLAAYVKSDGTTQALQGAVLASALAVGGGAINQTLPLPASGSLVVDSRDGVDVVCSFDTANSPAAGVLVLTIIYQRDAAVL